MEAEKDYLYYLWHDHEAEWRQEFAYLEKEKELKGLSFGGLTDSKKFVSLNSFNLEELMCAQKIIKCYFYSPSGRYNKFNNDYSSYGLKGMVEDILYDITDGRINYVSNGTVILAMYHCGFKFQRIPGTPNCLFNVPKKCYTRMENKRYKKK
ncbi:MAG: hypothetical protein K2M06_00975 [Muribaculaceae bacterium]|nr:hypothetical protein [Muribaculaceae bacterium]